MKEWHHIFSKLKSGRSKKASPRVCWTCSVMLRQRCCTYESNSVTFCYVYQSSHVLGRCEEGGHLSGRCQPRNPWLWQEDWQKKRDSWSGYHVVLLLQLLLILLLVQKIKISWRLSSSQALERGDITRSYPLFLCVLMMHIFCACPQCMCIDAFLVCVPWVHVYWCISVKRLINACVFPWCASSQLRFQIVSSHRVLYRKSQIRWVHKYFQDESLLTI